MTAPMTEEDRLKGILYRFIELQDRLLEDRLDAANQRAETAELVKLFKEEIKRFQALSPQYQQQITETVTQASVACAKHVGGVVQKAASEKLDTAATKLQQAVDTTTAQLNASAANERSLSYYWLALMLCIVIIVGFVVGRFSVPQPYLALTGEELETYQHGQVAETFWPKLSKEEQSRLLKLGRSGDAKEGSDGDQP